MIEVFIDMDGVIADFVGGALEVHGARREDVYPPGRHGLYEIHEAIGISEAAFWAPLGENFWAGLTKTPEANELVRMLNLRVPGACFLLSTPARSASSLAGKVLWIQNNFPQFDRRYFLGPKKWVMSAPGRLLIDDNEENCRKWRERGGRAFLFPRPWNMACRREGEALEALEEFLEDLA